MHGSSQLGKSKKVIDQLAHTDTLPGFWQSDTSHAVGSHTLGHKPKGVFDPIPERTLVPIALFLSFIKWALALSTLMDLRLDPFSSKPVQHQLTVVEAIGIELPV